MTYNAKCPGRNYRCSVYGSCETEINIKTINVRCWLCKNAKKLASMNRRPNVVCKLKKRGSTKRHKEYENQETQVETIIIRKPRYFIMSD